MGQEELAQLQKALGGEVIVWQRPGAALPLFIEPGAPELVMNPERFRLWFEAHRDIVNTALSNVGGIVFRGFAVNSTEDFAAFVDNYPGDALGYSGGNAQRSAIAGRVFEATRVAPHFRITLHQEMAYLPRYPTKVAFYCRLPSQTGGETILADMRQIDAAVDRKLYDRLKAEGLIHTRNFRAKSSPDDPPFLKFHRSWMDTFGTDDPRKAEADCETMGLEYEWQDDGSLSAIYRSSGFATHPDTGREIWFNQIQSNAWSVILGDDYALQAAYYADGRTPRSELRFGDGQLIPQEDIDTLMTVFDAHSTAFPWQAGDIMLLDNFYTAHGRNPFTGDRDVQVSLLF
ncbi:MAG TPA: TauD/TfdA family dioxygenase [Caulobacteraceae bacterium]|nr:TauD/TfdA family dioxygenase [Caulobacteraceae bacterium]